MGNVPLSNAAVVYCVMDKSVLKLKRVLLAGRCRSWIIIYCIVAMRNNILSKWGQVKSLVKLICVAGSTTTLRLDYRVALTTFLGLGVDKHWTNYSTLRRLKHGESVVTLSCRIGTLVCAEKMVQRSPSDEANGTKGALGAIVDC